MTARPGPRKTKWFLLDDGRRITVKQHETEFLAKQVKRAADGQSLFPESKLYGDRLTRISGALDTERVRVLAALFAAVLSGGNDYRTTSEFLVELAGSRPNQRHGQGDPFEREQRSLRNFAAGVPPREAGAAHHYLRMMVMLEYSKHPCLTEDFLARTLLDLCHEVADFRVAYDTAQEPEESVEPEHEAILEAGARFYSSLERHETPLDPDGFAHLLKSPYLADIQPSTHGQWSPKTFFAVRPGNKKGEVLTSTVQFYLFGENSSRQRIGDKPTAQERVYIYTTTTLTEDPGKEKSPISSGFMVPQKRGVYILSHQVNQFGFNATGFNLAQFDNDLGYLAGVLLAANRSSDSEPMVTRVALMRPFIDGICGRYPIEKFLEKEAEASDRVGRDSVGKEVLDYLFHAGDAEIAARGPDGVEYLPAETLFKTWPHADGRDLAVVLRRPMIIPKPGAG